MRKWQKLDLGNSAGHPPADMPVALRLASASGASECNRRIEYDIGRFKFDSRENSRKLWWHGTHGTQDPVRMKMRCAIWWCPVPEYDGP